MFDALIRLLRWTAMRLAVWQVRLVVWRVKLRVWIERSRRSNRPSRQTMSLTNTDECPGGRNPYVLTSRQLSEGLKSVR